MNGGYCTLRLGCLTKPKPTLKLAWMELSGGGNTKNTLSKRKKGTRVRER